jgi:hypothetical protein
LVVFKIVDSNGMMRVQTALARLSQVAVLVVVSVSACQEQSSPGSTAHVQSVRFKTSGNGFDLAVRLRGLVADTVDSGNLPNAIMQLLGSKTLLRHVFYTISLTIPALQNADSLQTFWSGCCMILGLRLIRATLALMALH